MAIDYYKNFEDNVRDLEKKQKEIASAPDTHTLNQLEREAQQLLFSLQHTSMGLAYWIQDTARARRKEFTNWGNLEKKVDQAFSSHKKEISIEVAIEKPQKRTKKKRSKKNATKRKEA